MYIFSAWMLWAWQCRHMQVAYVYACGSNYVVMRGQSVEYVKVTQAQRYEIMLEPRVPQNK